MDRNLQERPRGRYQPDPVAGPDTSPYRGRDPEYLYCCREAVEDGKADPDQMNFFPGLTAHGRSSCSRKLNRGIFCRKLYLI